MRKTAGGLRPRSIITRYRASPKIEVWRGQGWEATMGIPYRDSFPRMEGLKMTRQAMAVLACVLLATGCAATNGSRASAGVSSAAQSKVITQQELSEHPELTSVGDAVRRLRPTWREVPIYIGREPYAGSSRDIPLTFVKELRYLDVSEAQMQWGQSIATGILHVIKQ